MARVAEIVLPSMALLYVALALLIVILNITQIGTVFKMIIGGAFCIEELAGGFAGGIAAAMINVRGWAKALFEEPTSLAAFSSLNIPVLYMVGKESPASSRGVARLLTRTLPQVQVVEFSGLGHMGPITHAQIVNETISRFLRQG